MNLHHHDGSCGHSCCLRVENLSVNIGADSILSDINLHIHCGEMVALIGPNGAGKSTFLKAVLGQQEYSGVIAFSEPGQRSKMPRIGYVPQQANFDPAFPVPVQEVVRMGRVRPFSRKFTQEDFAAVQDALRQTETESLAGRPYSALSGGQRRRVLVARALASGPEMLILDEPTANMDEDSENRLSSVLASLKGKTTILLVTHDSDFVSALTDEVLCIGHGETGAADSVVRHRTEPAGNARLVHHETRLPDCHCAGH